MVSTSSVGKLCACTQGRGARGAIKVAGMEREPPSTRLRLVPCADAGDRRRPVLHERPHRISPDPSSLRDQKLSGASAHLRLPLQGDPGSGLAWSGARSASTLLSSSIWSSACLFLRDCRPRVGGLQTPAWVGGACRPMDLWLSVG